MKKIDFSKVFRKRRLLLSSFATIVMVPLLIFWVIPTIKASYGHFTHSDPGSLNLQIQMVIIFSIVIYPTAAFFLCLLVSFFRPLKSQDEGGLLSDIKQSLITGCVWFVIAAFLLIGGFSFMIIWLFMGTVTGIALLLLHSLSKEFNPNKLPIEKIGFYPG